MVENRTGSTIYSIVPLREIFCRVATAQGKQGVWLSIFPDRENTGNLGTTQGKFRQHREFSKFP